MSANNSISKLLEQFLELNTNSLETFERINEAITTDKQTVTITLYDQATGLMKPIQIPAFGYLKREIERLDTNVKSISGLDSANTNIRLKDGSYRRIHTSKLKGPSKSITSLAAPVVFNTRLNDFFEDFLNPLLTIELDVDNQIPIDTERVYVERFLFDDKDTNSIDLFKSNYLNASNINYANFKNKLSSEAVKFTLDSNIVDMPIRSLQYSGSIDVVDVVNTQVTQVVDGVTRTRSIKLFTLNKLTYSDSSKTMSDTEVLKVGDSLAINSESYSTRYKITSIDSSTSQVELQLIEGFEPVQVGVNQLKVYKGIDKGAKIELNIGYNEWQVIFIKPIDPISKIAADNYSPGIGFWSNSLQMTLGNGEVVNLAKYYKDEVADFGQFIKGLKVDYIPPASVALKPSSPNIDVANFKVVQINKHLTDNATTNKIIKLKSDKKAAEQSIKRTDGAISKKRSILRSRKFKSIVEKNQHKAELTSLINKRSDSTTLFASLVTDIKATAESTQVSAIAPKFRTRGFWAVPAPKTYGDELSQDIIQFIVRYRYLSSNGKTSTIEQLEFTDTTNQVTKTGAFSNWIERETSVKKRRLNEETGSYEWYFESEEDGQAINFNSLDIPLSPGESVEVMVKSVSEAGYPSNPIASDWSEPVKIEFPEEFSIDSVTGIVESNERDSIKVEIISDLEAKGVYSHINDSTEDFSHTSSSIASGFLSPEQNPISLYDKLVEMQLEIERLKTAAANAVGKLVVKIIDTAGNATAVRSNSVVKLFGGYYTQEVSHSSDYKGEIISKNFKIEISNSKATQLELVSIMHGDRTKASQVSTTSSLFGLGSGSIDGDVINNQQYLTEGNYDLVPVGYQNVDTVDLDVLNTFNRLPSQSSQVRGQFIYSRYMNISGDKQLYSQTNNTTTTGFTRSEYGIDLGYYGLTGGPVHGLNTSGWAALTGFSATTDSNGTYGVWDGVLGSTLGSNPADVDYNANIYIHMKHKFAAVMDIQTLISNGYVGMPFAATRKAKETESYQQSAYLPTVGTTSAGGVSYRRATKVSFDSGDKYTLGGRSCGAFLYMSPVDKKSLTVDSDNKFGKKSIESGDENTINVDLVWQYRMTDYNGVGVTGSGFVGGLTSNPTNLTYTKTIGIDIMATGEEIFSFDVEVTSSYRPIGDNINTIPSAQVQSFR
jgi:hypothetical protein